MQLAYAPVRSAREVTVEWDGQMVRYVLPPAGIARHLAGGELSGFVSRALRGMK